jgi:hypothetical protein
MVIIFEFLNLNIVLLVVRVVQNPSSPKTWFPFEHKSLSTKVYQIRRQVFINGQSLGMVSSDLQRDMYTASPAIDPSIIFMDPPPNALYSLA